MVKRSRGFIQLEWQCLQCESRNPGPAGSCESCGAPQPENVEFVAPSERKFVQDEKALEHVVYRSAKIKAEIVERDEKDLGLRAILNYGHTVGHAIESTSNFKVGHGEAVAIGMLAAARISNRMGILDRTELLRLESLIKSAGLPTEIPSLEIGELTRAMTHDKKVLKGKIRFVLPKSLGKVFITDEISPSLVEQILSGWNEKPES